MRTERVDLYDELLESIKASIRFRSLQIEQAKQVGIQEIIALDFTDAEDIGHYAYTFANLIRQSEELGEIEPGKTVLVETTSGTAGRGLAFVAKHLRYSVQLYMPDPIHSRRKDILEEMMNWDRDASELILTPSTEYVQGAVAEMMKFHETHHQPRLGAEPLQYKFLNHSRRPESIKFFMEIIQFAWKKFAFERDVSPVVIAALGGGCLSTPWFRHFKDLFPTVRCVGVEPIEAPVSWVHKNGEESYLREFGCEPRYLPHKMPGTAGWDVKFPLLDLSLVDEIELISEPPVDDMFNEIANEADLSLGRSTVGCIVAAINQTQHLRRITPFIPIYDSAEFY